VDYCRRCKSDVTEAYQNKTYKYCGGDLCRQSIKEYGYDKYANSDLFLLTSFDDCVDGYWDGFKDIQHSGKVLISDILNRFSKLQYVTSFTHDNRDKIESDKVLYIISDCNDIILKVGLTTSPTRNFRRYSCYEDQPLRYDIFIVNSYEEQELYEKKIRNYLEYLGHFLPKDDSEKRLGYINNTLVNSQER